MAWSDSVGTLGAAGAAWAGLRWVALAGWLAGRLLDGLDGPVARKRGQASDLGGYLDMLADTIGYVAVPLGVALSIDRTAGWISVAVLLGTFWSTGSPGPTSPPSSRSVAPAPPAPER